MHVRASLFYTITQGENFMQSFSPEVHLFKSETFSSILINLSTLQGQIRIYISEI